MKSLRRGDINNPAFIDKWLIKNSDEYTDKLVERNYAIYDKPN